MVRGLRPIPITQNNPTGKIMSKKVYMYMNKDKIQTQKSIQKQALFPKRCLQDLE
jgi:hypothetical protein